MMDLLILTGLSVALLFTGVFIGPPNKGHRPEIRGFFPVQDRSADSSTIL